ncbi:F-actin-monooxygenase Mical isoform X3 [Zerene cesonia]|uniref:F-actin-monooxygenase Mical isoform X3 n=1 Tax=Zerene cesonia TaxID=33412 RepID=UPI0018E58FFC|nr:F-actin-monooxygenase Mical isoform X3 [Zerene cesonia]
MNRGPRVEPTPPECALAAEMFDHFCSAGTMKQILALHREICNTLNLKPNRLPDFYPKLKAKLAASWKAQALFKKFDARANHKVYNKGKMCPQTKVLIIGAGPCGLRAAIECQLLGAKVVVVEKRDRISRNNVLHLWPFVIHDLRALGAKKFFGKFCAGSIDHISIRQLQCILMKVSLLLGVEIHEGVGFEELLEPAVSANSEILGWRARVMPHEHPVSQYEFDVLIGADGKRNTLQGFKRKEFRGKLAMAITANFINRHTEQEAAVPEISGVAFIFNQKFFKDLNKMTGIDLENIVYYKDDTHYFVMTAKKHSLLDKGVLLNDYPEVSRLLSVENVNRAALMRYAQEAARFSTDGRLPLRDFALNHYGEPDVALFDFTSMYAAENASIVYERLGRRLLCQLVGDSLLEPFWPTGSGCARGFLSALDSAWAVRAWGQTPHPHPLQVIAERESIYRLLAQTTPENLHRDFGAYTLDPGTRYPNLNRTAVTPHRVTSFYDSDDPLPLDTATLPKKRRRDPEVSEEALIAWVGYQEPGIRAAASPAALYELVKRYRPDLLADLLVDQLSDDAEWPIYHVLQQEFGIPPFSANQQIRDVPEAKLRSYLTRVYYAFKGEVPHIHHESNMFDQIKQSQQKDKSIRNTAEQSISAYSYAADTDKSHSTKRKRRTVRSPQVSNDPAEYIRKQIGKLDLNDITQLARLIEGHDAISDMEHNVDKQKELQDQILALLDPDDSPDPTLVRESLSELLQGSSKIRVKETPKVTHVERYFINEQSSAKKPTRKLKGLDPSTIRVPDFSSVFQNESPDTDDTLIASKASPKRDAIKHEKMLTRSRSAESPEMEPRRLSEIMTRRKNSDSMLQCGRSNSIGSTETGYNIKEITNLFEGRKKRQASSPLTRHVRSEAKETPERVLRWQQMADIIEGKRQDTQTYDASKRVESIGNPEMALRRQKVAELIVGNKPRQVPESVTSQRRNSGELAFRMQRVSDMMEKKKEEAKRHKGGGKRKAAREIMKQRFEKSLQMLAVEPRLNFTPSTDLENDYGLQQYRASAPQFDERVKKLEKQLQHYEEGKLVGGKSRMIGGGVRVAKLAAELSSTSNIATTPLPKASKPKDLMRSVGKINREDWNVKEIERKITENRLGRPEPKTAEKVPKWDREQFLGRQRKLKEGDSNDEKWGEIDETIHKIDLQLNDSGRPMPGTKKVANLATKFVKKADPTPTKSQLAKKELKEKKVWRGPTSAGKQCTACGTRVFAAEGVTADGLHLHRACFRCAVCKAVLRPGSYTMERYGTRLVCLRHSGVDVPEAGTAGAARNEYKYAASTPERISIELSDGAREIDEDEWTDRNFLASETSGAGGLSDDDDSSTDEYVDVESEAEAERSGEQAVAPPPAHSNIYFSDDSFGYDDYSDDGAESSGGESCSRMREAREARRREVPAHAPPPSDSSEIESDEESESSDEEVSSATEVSTDSEFAREESAPVPSPPAILVTEAPPPAPPPPQDYPLSRTKSAGGLATKRALELKRKYLLGEPSPPAVRKSDSTSQLDTKLEAFRSNITEFQKMLHPATTPTPQTASPYLSFQFTLDEKKPQPDIPDIIKNLCNDVPVDLLTKGDSPLCNNDWRTPIKEDDKQPDLETDSLSDDSSHTETLPNQSVPRVEVHDEGGELIQLDSLILANNEIDDVDEKISGTATATGTTVVAAESESSESCKDATTLALTETELSDWAAESAVLDDCGMDENTDKKRNKNPRTLSGPKLIHDAKNIAAIATHVCGRNSPPEVVYSNAPEHFEFADEGDQDLSIAAPTTPRNEGYMELVDDDYEPYSTSKDRSINFIERAFSDTTMKSDPNDTLDKITSNLSETLEFIDSPDSKSESILNDIEVVSKLPSTSNTSENGQKADYIENSSSMSNNISKDIEDSSISINDGMNVVQSKIGSVSLSDISPPLVSIDADKNVPIDKSNEDSKDDISPPLASEKGYSIKIVNTPRKIALAPNLRTYSPAICRSASETFSRSNVHVTSSPTQSMNWSLSGNFSSSRLSPETPPVDAVKVDKVQELKREREEQTEVVRRLVLERLGAPKVCRKSTRRNRISPSSCIPPPVPPPPVMAPPSPVLCAPPPPPPPPIYPEVPPRPAPPLMSLSVQSSFSDPELTRQRRPKGFMKSISNYFNKRLGPRHKCVSEPDLTTHQRRDAHTSMGALEAPPVPPPPVCYSPPCESRSPARPSAGPAGVAGAAGAAGAAERDAMQLWFEARWARLVAQRRARGEADEPAARRLARLERRLARPLSAEQQAATVAEIVQVSAQREAHQALMAADRRRNATNSVGD